MYNLFYSLPDELIRKIYEYDPTYKEKFNDVLKFIDEMAICTCPHSSNCLCCSSCPMHHPRYRFWSSEVSWYNTITYERISGYNNFESRNEYQILFNDEENISSNNNERGIEFNIISRMFIPQKSIQIINNKKRRQGRFKDMGHYQRREV